MLKFKKMQGEISMKIGACGSLLGLTYPLAKEIGFDYMEIPFRDLGKITDEEFEQMLLKKQEVGLPVLKANAMLPNDFNLFGENAKTLNELKDFLEKGFNRAKQLGIEVVVWGSGISRKYPENMDYQEVENYLLQAGNVIADYSEKYGIMVVIEPLNKGETNVFNTVKETYQFVKKLNRKTVKALADSFHMMAESESYDSLNSYKDEIFHAHIAEAKFGTNQIRLVPCQQDENNVKEFVEILKKIGYQGDISIEAQMRTGDWKFDMTEGLKALKSWIN